MLRPRKLADLTDADLEMQAAAMQPRKLARLSEAELERQAAAMQRHMAEAADAELERQAAALAEEHASKNVPAGIRAVKLPELRDSIFRRLQEQQLPRTSQNKAQWRGAAQAVGTAGDARSYLATTGSSACSSGCRFGLLGDTPWFARPLAWCVQQGQAWGPQMLFQRLAAATEKLPQAQHDAAAALQVFAAALGSDVTEPMSADVPRALFAEAARLLFAVIGFTCEGTYPPVLRGRALSRAAQTATWPGVAPQALLGQWFNLPALLTVFSGAPVRGAFEGARKQFRAQFVCALSRAAFLEVGQQEVRQGRLLRMAWAKVFECFPEVALVRALCGHVRRRCWEDARDRSRSRSRSRERKKKNDPQGANQWVPPNCLRFFVKGCGRLAEVHLEAHFQKFGTIYELTILYDKKTQKSRGLAFVTLKPEGYYRGRRNTPDMLRDWVLATTHIVGGLQLDVSEASVKSPEDEEKKREERVEERRRQRQEREQRLGRSGAVEAEERLVASLWARRWRQEIFERLPKELEGPAPWTSPRVTELCCALWNEIVEHATKTGTQELQDALELFVAEAAEEGGPHWAFVPAADMLLLVGDGLVGITAEGVFANNATTEAIAPPPGFDQVSLKTVQLATPVASVVPTPTISYTSGDGRLQRGGSDREKVFVGGLTPHTTLEMLMGYFQSYGKITDAVVMMDKATGKPRGFGFVVFENVAMVDTVLRDYSIHRIDGKWVEVKRATPQELAPAAGQAQVVPPPGQGSPVALGGAQPATASPASPPAEAVVSPTAMGGGEGTATAAAPAKMFSQVPPPSFSQVPPPKPEVPFEAPASFRTFVESAPQSAAAPVVAETYDPLAE